MVENEGKVSKMKCANPNATYLVNSAGHLAMVEEYDPSTMVIKTLTSEMRLTPEQLTMLAEAFRKAARTRDERKAVAN